jgi:hypothetical protein
MGCAWSEPFSASRLPVSSRSSAMRLRFEIGATAGITSESLSLPLLLLPERAMPHEGGGGRG